VETPSWPECPHCRERAREDRVREQADRLRLEDRISDYQDRDGRDDPGFDR
jgi:hypothetical protein